MFWTMRTNASSCRRDPLRYGLLLQAHCQLLRFRGVRALIRPAVLVAAAAAALILAPTPAMAQTPAGFSVSVSTRAPAALVPFTIRDSGAKPNELVTLTMTPNPASIGTRSLTQHANARGVVSFAVALTQDGTYVLPSTSASGAVLGTETVTVSQHGSVVVAGSSASAGTTASAPAGKAASAPAGKAASAPAGKAASAPAGTAASAPAGK